MQLLNRRTYRVLCFAFCLYSAGTSLSRSFAQVVSIDKREARATDIENQLQKQVQAKFPDDDLALVPKNWIIFAANPAFSKVGLGPDRHMSYSGHIFVILATEDQNKKETRIDSYGFYPAAGANSATLRAVFNSVPGSVEDNLTGSEAGSLTQSTRIFSVQVTGYQLQNAVKAMWTKYPRLLDDDRKATDDFDSSDPDIYGPTYTTYSIPNNDCVTFANAVASAVGLKTPSLSGLNLTPNGYLTSLEGLNTSGPPGQGDQQIYTRLNYAYSPAGEPTGYYEGTTDENGKYHGHGVITAPSGVRYDLSFTHGRPDGAAHFSFPDGGELTGTLNGGTLTNGVYVDPAGGTHAVSLNADGSIHYDDQSSGGGGGNGGGGGSGRGGEHQSGAGAGAKGDHPSGADHWSLGSHDMGETHMGDIHPSQ